MGFQAQVEPCHLIQRYEIVGNLSHRAREHRLDRSVAQEIVSLKGVRQSGARAGNWLP
jgi:hypothetical protein